MKFTILIPVYNEERAVRDTIKSIRNVMDKFADYEIIAINDGSKDHSGTILSSIENLKVIENPYNLGYGASLKKGLMSATGEYIIITDADGTYPITAIPELISYLPKYDMVVGARRQMKNVPLLRRPAKMVLSFFANILAGRKIPDLNSGLRVFRRDMAMKFMKLYPDGFSFTTTITLAALTNSYTVKYIPINYYKRQGKSSIKPIRDFFGFLTLIFKIMLYFDPLKFFLWPGLLIMFFGIFYGIYQVISINNVAQLPILLVLGGLQICFLGLVADLIVKKG